MCIKLVSIKELYYDARPTKSQNKQAVTKKLISSQTGRKPVLSYNLEEDHDQQHCYHHAPTVKPEAATAVVELQMMGVRTPETC